MRLLTWNINGIRTVPQYHPWNTLGSFDDILNYLEADIINFQEVKQARSALPKAVALPASYDSFFSFPVHKNGYSGVATYTRSEVVVPLKAEEGITGLLHAPQVDRQRRSAKQPKLALSREERVSSSDSSYPGLSGLNGSDDEDGPSSSEPHLTFDIDLKVLDSEGRTLVLDFGLFVLINVYCPNDGSADEVNNKNRTQFKTDFHNVLEARIKSLIREGREVILVGDLNACATINDHCEGEILVKRVMRERASKMIEGDADAIPEEIFWEEKQSRTWLKDLLSGEKKCFIDVTRMYHPERKGMYTCWNTKISARDSNYGTRIDYILVTPNLLPWIKFSDIQPQIKGSDHCPVFVDLHDEREIDGKTVKLRDLFLSSAPTAATKRDPPRLATRCWDEYSGKQRVLDSFFKGAAIKKQKTKEQSTDSITKLSELTVMSQESSSTTSTASITNGFVSGASASKRPRSPSVADVLPEASSSLPITPAFQSKRLKKEDSSLSGSSSKSQTTVVSPAVSESEKPQLAKDKEKEDQTGKFKPGRAKLSSFSVAPSSDQGKGKQNDNAKGMKGTKEDKKNDAEPKSGSLDKGKAKADEVPERMEVDLIMKDVDMENADSIEEDADYRLAMTLSQESVLSSPSSTPPAVASASKDTRKTGKNNAASGAAWKKLLAKPPPPRCVVHNEEAKQFRVNKPGLNKGRSFWACSRPVGPGYDRGLADRPRVEVDPQWKCNFFMWSSDLKKEAKK